MSKKLVHDVALIATKLHEAGLSLEDAQRAAEHCFTNELTQLEPDLGRRLEEAPSDILWRGFTWGQTPEGHDYWAYRAALLYGVSYEH